MKTSKEKLIDAAKAFNRAQCFDEFKVLLDLCDVKLEDFEQDYFEVANIHPIFKDIISCGGKLDTFNSRLFMALEPKKTLSGFAGSSRLLSRFRLPLWFEKDEFSTVKMMLSNGRTVQASYSLEFAEGLASIGLDPTREIAQTLLYELWRA